MKSFEYTIKDRLRNPPRPGRNAGKETKKICIGMHHHKKMEKRKN